MPKKNKFTINITDQFRKAQAEAAENDAAVDETVPEHFKYGVYYDDDYNYMQHLVSKEDFNNPNFDLPQIEIDLKEILISKTSNEKVPNDFEENVNLFENNEEIGSEEGEKFFENLIEESEENKNSSEDEINYSGTLDSSNEKGVSFSDFIKSLKDLTDEFNEEPEDSDSRMEDSDKRMKLIPDCFDKMLETYGDAGEVKINPLTEEERQKILACISPYETEYNEEEINKVIDGLMANRKAKPTRNPFNPPKRIRNDRLPKRLKLDFSDLSEEKNKKEKEKEPERDRLESNDSIDERNVFVHKARPKDESSEDKKERKREIKEARKNRRAEKKINQKLHSR